MAGVAQKKGGKSQKRMKKTDKITIADYVEHVKKGNVRCFWDPAGVWADIHGDNKATTKGKYHTQCMKTSGDKPTYRVRIMNGASVAHGPIDLPNESKPTDDEVVDFLKTCA